MPPRSASPSDSLPRAHRAFLAESRRSPVNAAQWRQLRTACLAALTTCSSQALHAAISTLNTHRHVVPSAQWQSFVDTITTKLTDTNNTTLLNTLLHSVFSPSSTNPSSPPPSLNKRKSPSPSTVPTARPQSKRPRTTSPTTLHTSTFHLLSSSYLPAPLPPHVISLQQIVTAGADLSLIANYKFDIPWLFSNAPALETSRKILIIHGESEAEHADFIATFKSMGLSSRVRLHRPETPPYGTVHAKLFVQCFPTGCRVCVHTANMISADWDFKTQGAYVRDFPLKQDTGHSHATAGGNDFALQLHRYFGHVLKDELRDDVQARLARYDFSSAGVALVTSVPGVHRGAAKMQFGHARLRHLLIQEEIEEEDGPSAVVCQFSSLGSVQEKWLEGEFKETLFASQSRVTRNGVRRGEVDEIKFVYPTVKQVQESNEGIQAGGSLPVTGRNMNRGHILRKLHRWDAEHSGRARAMPHIKTFVRYPCSRPQEPYWVFLGSFNLSVAAWGRMQGGRKGKQSWDRLNVLAYEVGVLFIPRLMCPPAHAIDSSIRYPLVTSAERQVWSDCKRSGNVKLRLVKFDASENDRDRSRSDKRGFSRGVNLWVPLPYRLPPPAFSSEDSPWTVDQCAMS